MKNLLFVLLFSASMIVMSCEDDTANECATTTYRFTNTSDNPYSIKINNSIRGSINGGTFKEFSDVPGTYSYRVEQLSGYILYPTIREGTFNLGCEEIGIVFP